MNADAEFTSLRQEMLQSETHIVNVSIFVITVVGASITAAFQFLNPLVALFPLLVLYLGYVIVFNNVQTIAIIGTYLRVFWEEEHTAFHWETRQAQRRAITEEEEATRAGKRSGRWEEWMGPLAQHMFFATGLFCILMFALISYIVLSSLQRTNIIPLFSLVANVGIILITLVLLGIWSWLWKRSRKLTNVIHGEDSMMEQFNATWQEVKKMETAKQDAKSRRRNQRSSKIEKRQ